MTDRARIRIATAAIALFLAGISAAGLAARDHRPIVAASVAATSRATPAPEAVPVGVEGIEELEDDD